MVLVEARRDDTVRVAQPAAKSPRRAGRHRLHHVRVRRGAGLCFGSGFRGTEDRFLIASVLAGCLVVLILLSKPRGANTSRCQREQIMTYEIAIIVGSPSP